MTSCAPGSSTTAGARYAVKYTPSKDIAGDHTVDISYGFAAGLDPNRATVLLLQLDGASLVSRDYIRRTLPVDINAVEEPTANYGIAHIGKFGNG